MLKIIHSQRQAAFANMEFTIKDSELAPLKGQVVVLTGGSSGIGLATTKLLLSLGCFVVAGDLAPSPITDAALTSLITNVTSWPDLLTLFKTAVAKHGRVDHVLANAGMGGKANYFTAEMDAQGELMEPSTLAYDIMLRGVINTSYLGLHHMRTQSPAGGSIVLTASASSFQRFGITDYVTAKHGVLGFMRGIVPNLLRDPALAIRMNAIAPSWTETGIIPDHLRETIGSNMQSPDVVARNVALLFADGARQGQLIYSVKGRYYEIEENVLLPAATTIVGGVSDAEVVNKFLSTAGPPAS